VTTHYALVYLRFPFFPDFAKPPTGLTYEKPVRDLDAAPGALSEISTTSVASNTGGASAGYVAAEIRGAGPINVTAEHPDCTLCGGLALLRVIDG
jgi:hypothetical protein